MDLLPGEPRFIPLISDYGFKATFGNEANTVFLQRALQALLQSPVPIADITFLPNELGRLTRDSRGGVYDLACRDAAGNHFIVEMQLSFYPEFLQRMKFYSLFRLNTLVQRGDYTFSDLPRIYCIGILATTIFPHVAAYHNAATLRNASGELLDDQTTFITVELDKFTKPLTAVSTDLDKLLYTMKTLHTTTEPTQYPQFWDEDWLRLAIEELDKRRLTPEELLVYQMTLSANALAVHSERRRIEAAVQEATAEATAEAKTEAKTEAVRIALQRGKLTPAEIAEYNGVSLDFVAQVQQQTGAV